MQILFSRRAAKAVSRMDTATKSRVRRGIQSIPSGDVKPFKSSAGSYRLRIGDWRIIFSYQDNDTILVEDIGRRGQIYK
ncbi:MAG: type II toxin-antitoxin system RelE/ParE family toxin [Defluviitaleaceae bacterium]|nr:type II toxin-antitoxin system RelE/ParE family toxin [Defluviitaleaceae bacterium]